MWLFNRPLRHFLCLLSDTDRLSLHWSTNCSKSRRKIVRYQIVNSLRFFIKKNCSRRLFNSFDWMDQGHNQIIEFFWLDVVRNIVYSKGNSCNAKVFRCLFFFLSSYRAILRKRFLQFHLFSAIFWSNVSAFDHFHWTMSICKSYIRQFLK